MKNELIIKDKIHTIRDQQVMLDRDLAELYGVENRMLNQAVKRNIGRFPDDFMFQLTTQEIQILKSQFVTSSWGGVRKLPYAFTEHGVAMLVGVLKSQRAIEVNIQIMRAFIAMRRYLAANASLFQRVESVEKEQIEQRTKLLEHDQNFKHVFNAIEEKDIKPSQGIFFNGQIFDAHKFISDLIKSAKKSIILIDNYVDESTLALFTKNQKVEVTIYTRTSKQLSLDVKRYISQYKPIIIKDFIKSHDRFIIIDDTVYHFGASLKDLGRKWFAFSKFGNDSCLLLDELSDSVVD